MDGRVRSPYGEVLESRFTRTCYFAYNPLLMDLEYTRTIIETTISPRASPRARVNGPISCPSFFPSVSVICAPWQEMAYCVY